MGLQQAHAGLALLLQGHRQLASGLLGEHQHLLLAWAYRSPADHAVRRECCHGFAAAQRIKRKRPVRPPHDRPIRAILSPAAGRVHLSVRSSVSEQRRVPTCTPEGAQARAMTSSAQTSYMFLRPLPRPVGSSSHSLFSSAHRVADAHQSSSQESGSSTRSRNTCSWIPRGTCRQSCSGTCSGHAVDLTGSHHRN